MVGLESDDEVDASAKSEKQAHEVAHLLYVVLNIVSSGSLVALTILLAESGQHLLVHGGIGVLQRNMGSASCWNFKREVFDIESVRDFITLR